MKNISLLGTTLAIVVSLNCAGAVSAQEDFKSLYLQAYSAIAKHDNQSAVTFAEQSIKMQPSALAFVALGKAKLEMQKFDEAIKAATSALELDTQAGGAFIVRAMARKALGDKKNAAADAEKAVALEPTDVAMLSVAAILEQENQDFKTALEHYNASIKLILLESKSGSTKHSALLVDLYGGRAEANAMLHNFKDALSDFDHAIGLNATNSRYFVDRGAIKDELGDHKGAIADYDSALQLKPDDAVAYKLRSESKGDLGDKVGAASDLDKASKLMK